MAVLPVYNVLVVPGADLYLKTDMLKRSAGRMPYVGEKIILVIERNHPDNGILDKDSFYPIGVIGEVTEINNSGYFVIHTKNRVNLEEVSVYGGNVIDVSISRRKDTDDLDENEEKERLRRIKSTMNAFADGFQNSQVTRLYIAKMNSLEEIATLMSPWMMSGSEERYHILELDSRHERSVALEKLILENIEMTRINIEARSAQEEDTQKIYRESAIKKQMEFLQKELDEMHPEDVSDVRRFELAVDESGMNETARREAKKIINRLKQEGKNSPESGMLYDYLDFLTGLSWKKEEMHRIDLNEAERILDEQHYGLGKVKNRILQQIAVMNLRRRQSGSILLFVGAPGTGKTSIGQSIAKALDREYVRVSLGGIRDEADIRGHRRTYIGAMPGRIMDGIRKSGVSNPVMVLDEIDKLGASYNGDPASALLEVLDPEQNRTFTDHYMNVPYDLSDVLFICTANTLDTIPAPLLDRMEIIRFTGYSPLDKMSIAKTHLLPRSMEMVGIPEDVVHISDETLEEIISGYTREAGVRGLKKCLDQLCRTAAVRIVRDGLTTLDVRTEDLRELLDTHPIHRKHVEDSGEAGVVTGLAWTAVGGEILNIETLITPGSGKMIITGQLGDVMKESAQIALTLVKSIFPDRMQDMQRVDLHIHVPDGATPKDGPSAGITMTTALASLVSGVPVSPKVGMTGEITLQGKVGAIGGLPEKLMAAQRAGVTTVYIPEENVEDLRDVPQEVVDALKIIPVRTASDVLTKLGILPDYAGAAAV